MTTSLVIYQETQLIFLPKDQKKMIELDLISNPNFNTLIADYPVSSLLWSSIFLPSRKKMNIPECQDYSSWAVGNREILMENSLYVLCTHTHTHTHTHTLHSNCLTEVWGSLHSRISKQFKSPEVSLSPVCR